VGYVARMKMNRNAYTQSCSRNAGRKENTWKNVEVNEGIILKLGLRKQDKKCEQDTWIGRFGIRRHNNAELRFRVS
jgi:hypothetical protein